MTQYPHIEDYLELLSGQSPNSYQNPSSVSPILIQLANYDVSVISSMAGSTLFGSSLTDKQSELAIRLILKYRRQFASHGIDVSPAENPVFRKPLRIVNRDKLIWRDGDNIKIQFPFDGKLVADTRLYAKESQGRFEYDHSSKIWTAAITESNVNWIVAWGKANRFQIDSTIEDLFNLIIQCEDIPYSITLIQTPSGFEITNAADSLIKYINDNCGGFGPDNAVSLIDNAQSLGYTVSINILNEATEKHGGNLNLFEGDRRTHLRKTIENFARILDYAEITNRFPIYVYDPMAYFQHNSLRDSITSYFGPDAVLMIPPSGKMPNCDYDTQNVKLIYATKLPVGTTYRIPLLITTQELLFGGVRQEWAVRAERIVNYCDSKLKG